MKSKYHTTRREFINKTGLVAAGVTLGASSLGTPFGSGASSGSLSQGSAEGKYPVRLFSKPLDTYEFGFMCECIVKSGIGGIDLVVRPGGRVEPDIVEKELPERIAEAKKFGLVTDMMVTVISSVSDPLTERVLKTASASGVKYYRFNWFDYDLKLGIMESIQKYRNNLKDLAELNRKYKIHGGYQNHAGAKIGGPVWDLNELLRDFPTELIGSQYDVRHAMVEGTDTWMLGMRLIASHIKTLAIKDFTWKTVNGKPQAVTVPMGEGMVNWDLFFKTVKELNITGPLTIHIEYPLLESGEEKLTLIQQQEIIVRKLKKDADFINSYLTKYQLV